MAGQDDRLGWPAAPHHGGDGRDDALQTLAPGEVDEPGEQRVAYQQRLAQQQVGLILGPGLVPCTGWSALARITSSLGATSGCMVTV